MKHELDALEKGVGLREKGRKLTPAQIKAAREWIDNGVKYSDDLVDAVKMSYKYNSDGGPKNKEQAEGYGRKALAALDDFNSRFMNDAGGWEFAGEHLSEAGFGPAGKLLFKQASCSASSSPLTPAAPSSTPTRSGATRSSRRSSSWSAPNGWSGSASSNRSLPRRAARRPGTTRRKAADNASLRRMSTQLQQTSPPFE